MRAIARNPNIDLQSMGFFLDQIDNITLAQQFQKLLTNVDTFHRKSMDQNLRKLAGTPGFSDI